MANNPRETKIPAIPELASIKDPQTRRIFSAVKEALEVRLGRRGDPLDRGVTLRDLFESGMITYRGQTFTGNGFLGGFAPTGAGGSGSGSGSESGSGAGGGNGELIYETPPAPTDLVAQGGTTRIFVSWNPAVFEGYAYAEVWRSQIDDLGAAVMISTTIAHLFADPVESGESFYYWVRFVNVEGTIGEFNGTAGTYAEAQLDPAELMRQLEEAIINTEFHQELVSRIAQNEGAIGDTAAQLAVESAERAALIAAEIAAEAEARSAEIAARVADETAARGVAILAEQETRSAADEAIASSVAALGVEINDGLAGEAAARSAALSLIDSRIDATDGTVAAQGSELTRIENELSQGITDEATARSLATSALDSRVTAAEGNITTQGTELTRIENELSQGIADEATARSLATSSLDSRITENEGVLSAQASQFTELSAEVGGHSATLLIQGEAIAGVGAEYTIKTDVEGRVAGIGLVNSGESSAFEILADKFAIFHPEASSTLVFGVSGGRTVIDGANIKEATITDAHITDLDVTTLTGDTSQFVKANIGTAEIGFGQVTGDLISANYSATEGWLFPRTGNAVLNGATVRGTIESAGYSPYVQGYRLTNDGGFTLRGTGGAIIMDTSGVAYGAITGDKPPVDATRNQTYFQNSAPSSGSLGDIWVDTDDNQIYTHNGTKWISGRNGADGRDGVDGVTPTLLDNGDGTYAITNGTQTIVLRDGNDGQNAPIPVVTSNGNGTYTITDGTGNSVTLSDGADGTNGYTPIKGVDYFDGSAGETGPEGAPGAYISFIFRKSTTQPVTPTGGTFNGTSEGIPSGWTDNPTSTDGALEWLSKTRYSYSNGAWSHNGWSTPAVHSRMGQDGADGATGATGATGPAGRDGTEYNNANKLPGTYIQSLGVDTLQIAYNAVTIPVASYYSGTLQRGYGTHTVRSLSINTGGGPLYISATASISVYAIWSGGDGGEYVAAGRYYLTVDGSIVYDSGVVKFPVYGGGFGPPMTIAISATAGGSYSTRLVELKFQVIATSGQARSTATSLFALGTKR